MLRQAARTNTLPPRWPPVESGLPVESTSALLETQQRALIRLKFACGVTDAFWAGHYLPIINKAASWFHLLPASREHHHYGAGGLLRHAIECAVAAAGLFDDLIIGQSVPSGERIRYRLGMQWAAVTGAMLHDCAKPLTDLSVTGERTGSVWNPIRGSLAAWAEASDEQMYHIRWRPNRVEAHHSGAAIMFPRIVGATALSWLVETAGIEALTELIEAILDGEQPGVLASIIVDADRISVSNDLAHRGSLNERHEISGMAAEKHLLDAMRALLREGTWRAGSKVCVKAEDGFILLAWPKAGHDLAEWLSRHNLPGIVRNQEAIADVLIDTGVAEPGEPGDHGRYHRLRTPEGLELRGLKIDANQHLSGLTAQLSAGGTWLSSDTRPATTSAGGVQGNTPALPSANPAVPNPGAQSDAPIADKAESPATPSQPDTWLALVERCDAAQALVEDLAIGKSPMSWLHCDAGGHRFFAYPDAFKGMGMPPLAAARTLVNAGLAASDGNRIAEPVEGAEFKKGVRVALHGPLRSLDSAAEDVREWVAHQADTDVKESGSDRRRFVTKAALLRWASLYGDPERVLARLKDDKVLVFGLIDKVEYARLATDGEKKQ